LLIHPVLPLTPSEPPVGSSWVTPALALKESMLIGVKKKVSVVEERL